MNKKEIVYGKKIIIMGLVLVVLIGMVTTAVMAQQNDGASSGFFVTEKKHTVTTPTYENSLLKELGIAEPKKGNISLMKYSAAKKTIDPIMNQCEINAKPAQIVGVYDFGDYKTILVGRNNTVLLIQWDGKKANITEITPTHLGTKKTSDQKIATLGGDSVGRETLAEVYRVSVPVPNALSQDQQIDIVKMSRTDVYLSKTGKEIATLVTAGDFYVDYGNSITSISDKSSHSINGIYGTAYSKCEFTSTPSGAGTTSGELKTHYKAGTLGTHISFDEWLICDAWESTDDGGSANSWVSLHVPPDNCTD